MSGLKSGSLVAFKTDALLAVVEFS